MLNILIIRQKQLDSLNKKLGAITQELGFDNGDGSLKYLERSLSTGAPSDITEHMIKKGEGRLDLLGEFLHLSEERRELSADIFFLEHPELKRPQLTRFTKEETEEIRKAIGRRIPLTYCESFRDKSSLGKAYNETRRIKFDTDVAAAEYAIKEGSAFRISDDWYIGNYFDWLSIGMNTLGGDLTEHAYIDEECYKDSQFDKEEILSLHASFGGIVPPILEKCSVYSNKEELAAAHRKLKDVPYTDTKEIVSYLTKKHFLISLPTGRYIDRTGVD